MSGLYRIKIDTPKGRLVNYFTDRYEFIHFKNLCERRDDVTVADWNEYGFKIQENAKQANDDLDFFIR